MNTKYVKPGKLEIRFKMENNIIRAFLGVLEIREWRIVIGSTLALYMHGHFLIVARLFKLNQDQVVKTLGIGQQRVEKQTLKAVQEMFPGWSPPRWEVKFEFDTTQLSDSVLIKGHLWKLPASTKWFICHNLGSKQLPLRGNVIKAGSFVGQPTSVEFESHFGADFLVVLTDGKYILAQYPYRVLTPGELKELEAKKNGITPKLCVTRSERYEIFNPIFATNGRTIRGRASCNGAKAWNVTIRNGEKKILADGKDGLAQFSEIPLTVGATYVLSFSDGSTRQLAFCEFGWKTDQTTGFVLWTNQDGD